jgi:hypothetical protein
MAEVYKGMEIAISTTQTSDQGWISQAEYQVPGKQGVRVEPPQLTYATEAEAHQAALRAAVESIDRMRVNSGKP